MINPFVNREYLTVDAFDGVSLVKNKIIEKGCAVVFMDDEPIGLITPRDLAASPHNLIVDCLSKKPKLLYGSKIKDALKIMDESRSEILAVYHDDELVGTLFKGDIANHLMTTIETHHSNLQEVAHDLRTPVANLMGIIQLMEESFIDSENEELFSAAKIAYKNANNLISEILKPTIHPAFAIQVTPFELRKILEESVLQVQDIGRNKNIQIFVNLPESNIFSSGHSLSIKRAIDNILNNAIKFTKPGGSVEITSELKAEHCFIRIADNGIGIPDEMKPFLFEKFTSARRVGTSGEATTGMGLHITRQICESNAVGLRVISTVGEGTVFELKFKLIGILAN
ncbi:sensor histidine kinase [Pedobacter cryoconitis]|uniref:histidine kinase n=1 Tax=Pedobacter cryoconitis TaxID=188932 RepID=A0A7X0J1V5_9SPHI|nr:HAMP domain-containing sensor histidine kinase [Pedobacter cryoconitis]MBB6499149.1 signal transduction histidine kinase [Pedobacter cryoconitis]